MAKYESFYELLHGAESIPHPVHFIDTFSGADINDLWTKDDISGTGSIGISDSIDDGGFITTGAGSNNRTAIYFNNLRQYSPTNSILIGIVKRESGASSSTRCGLDNDNELAVTQGDGYTTYEDSTNNSHKALRTGDTTNESLIDSSIVIDNIITQFVLETNSNNNILSIGNVLEVTKTTNLPTVKLQPVFHQHTHSANARTGRIRYMECYNK